MRPTVCCTCNGKHLHIISWRHYRRWYRKDNPESRSHRINRHAINRQHDPRHHGLQVGSQIPDNQRYNTTILLQNAAGFYLYYIICQRVRCHPLMVADWQSLIRRYTNDVRIQERPCSVNDCTILKELSLNRLHFKDEDPILRGLSLKRPHFKDEEDEYKTKHPVIVWWQGVV